MQASSSASAAAPGAVPPPVPSSSAALLDGLWRALAYCFHPRVIVLSILPLILAMVCLGGLAWWGWSDAVALVRQGLDSWSLSQSMLTWLDGIGASGFRTVLAPLLVVIVTVPLVVVACLLLVAMMMTPAIVQLVAARRFPVLVSRHRSPWWASLGWSLGATLVALVALLVTLPLWFIPPFALVLPPLIWGWLTYRVMAYDTLAEHATPGERRQLLQRYRTPLLTMGILTGYMGAAPSALWAMGALTLVLAPVLLVASVWVYTLIFALSSLWFSHFLLAALDRLRQEEAAQAGTPGAASPPPVSVPDAAVIDVPAREVTVPPAPPRLP